MASRTVTLALDGEVSLRHFVDAMRHFRGLIDALSNEVARNVPIEWIVQHLDFSSTVATARGESEAPEYVERVASAFLTTGKAIEGNQPTPYSDKVLREAQAITAVLNGKIKSVRFETSDDDATIYSRSEGQTRPTMLKAYGAIEGRIQTLTERGSLRFTLYDTLNDKAVSCYLTEDQQELMRGVWGRRAIVQGRVSRDPLSGRPVAIRNITNVEVMDGCAARYVSAGARRRADRAGRTGRGGSHQAGTRCLVMCLASTGIPMYSLPILMARLIPIMIRHCSRRSIPC